MRLFLILFLIGTARLLAVNAITPGSLVLDSTMENLSVTNAYTGDDNGNATAVLEYSVNAGASWLPVYTNTNNIDRRTTITGVFGTVANPYVKQFRACIVGLTQNTSYQVRVTWTDSDGVSGTNPATATLSTLLSTPATGGSTITCNNDTDFTAALASAVAGQTIHLNNATYPTARTISISGTSGAWIKIEGGTGAVVGSGDTCISVTGAYIFLSGFTVAANGAAPSGSPFQQYGVSVGATGHHVLVDTITFAGIGGTGGIYANNYGTSGVGCLAGSHHVYCRGCSFTTTNSATDYNSSYVFGFSVAAGSSTSSTFIVTDNNSWSGHFRDCISSEGNDSAGLGDGFRFNCDIMRNTIPGTCLFYDDGIEADGDNINCRIIGNTVTSTVGNSALSTAGTNVGPCYVLRNYFENSSGNCAIKLGNGCAGPEYIFHNTLVTLNGGLYTTADAIADLGGSPMSELFTIYNDVFKTYRYGIYRGGRSNVDDYCVFYPDPAGNNFDINEYNTVGSYQTVSAYNTGTGQEAHGVQGNPNLNANGTLQAGSIAINVGLALSGFNGPNTPWPYTNANPAAGFAEFSAGTTNSSSMNGKITLTGKIQIK